MTENLKFLYFGNGKPDNEKEVQKEEEKNLVSEAKDAEKAEAKERLKVERIKILTKQVEEIYEKIKSSIGLSKEAFIQKYIANHTKERSL